MSRGSTLGFVFWVFIGYNYTGLSGLGLRFGGQDTPNPGQMFGAKGLGLAHGCSPNHAFKKMVLKWRVPFLQAHWQRFLRVARANSN